MAPLFAIAAPATKPRFDGNSKCDVQGFKINPSAVVSCCLKYNGGSDIQFKSIKCTLPIEAASVFSLEGKSKCKIEGFKIDPLPVQACCNENRGISMIDDRLVYCHVDLDKEGPFRKCVQEVGQATVVDCDY
ncbi:hypothetical protein BGZ73_004687 [Actinomortierella ambigua]|nr:hypothetical protein BGZ73_004687 [Actinomortierella ambigua]